MRRHGLVLTLVLVPLFAIGAESLLWLLAARQVQTTFHEWVAARKAGGWQVAAGAERLGGWPFAALVRIAGFSISGGTALLPGGLSWSSERLALRLSLSSPGRLVVQPAGLQNLRLFGGPTIVASASRISASVRFAVLPFLDQPAPPEGLLITASRVHIRPAAIHSDLITAATVAVQAMPALPRAGQDQSGPSLRFEATGIGVAQEQVAALGTRISVFSFFGSLVHQVPNGTNWTSRLADWRDHGGTVAVRSLSVVWGQLAVGGSGRVTLDQNLQPAGQATARLVGYAATLDALADAGSIGSGVATAAKALLTLLARPSSSGGPPEVDVPLSLENRTLSLGQIPLLKLPSVTWPSAS